MAHRDDRYEGANGGSFIIGLFAGTMLGAGLGLLFAPKSGSDLRNQLSDQAGTIGQTASEGYRRASETASELADKGRNVYGKVREVVSRGTDELKRETSEWPS